MTAIILKKAMQLSFNLTQNSRRSVCVIQPSFPASSEHSAASPLKDPSTDKMLICPLETAHSPCIIHRKTRGDICLVSHALCSGERASRSCAPFCFAAVVCVSIFTSLSTCSDTPNLFKSHSVVLLTSQVAIISFFSPLCEQPRGFGEIVSVC